MKTILLGVMLALLAGCASDPVIVTQEVRVPVPVTCVNPADVPPARDLATDSLHRGDTLFTKVQAMAIDVKGLQQDDLELRAILKGCVGDEFR